MMCQKIAGLVNLLRLLLSAVAVFACVGVSINAVAAPITYTMFAVTDVSLDGHFYHNAQVHLKFVGDTIDIKKLDPPVDGVTGYKITKGRSTLLIITGGRNIRAEFKPHQLLVSLDTSNGGGGFSSYVGADHHLEPAYPLAIDGTSINDANNARDLISPRAYTGHAWSCIGFPPFLNAGGRCSDPAAFPLKTDRGDFIIYQPYQDFRSDGTQGSDSGSLNTGIFSVEAIR